MGSLISFTFRLRVFIQVKILTCDMEPNKYPNKAEAITRRIGIESSLSIFGVFMKG